MIELAITTAADARLIAGPLAAWVEKVRAQLLDPVVAEMQRRVTEPRAGSAAPAPAGCDVGFALEQADSLRVANYKYTDTNWGRVLSGVLESKWRTLKVSGWYLDESGAMTHPRASVELVVDLRGLEWPDGVQLVVVALDEDLAGAELGGDRQATLIDLLRRGASSLQADSGYLTRGESLLYRTPHEAALGVAAGIGVDYAAQWLRGTFWANLLTQEHVRKLGGRERVLHRAPCAIAEELDERLVYLQATGDFWGDFEEELRGLAAFFAPALITKGVTLPQAPPSMPVASEPVSADDDGWLRVEDTLDPSSARFVLEVRGRLGDQQAEALDQLLDSWGRIGLLGGFGGHFHGISGREIVTDDGDNTKIMWSMDLGTAADEGVTALTTCLAELSAQQGWHVLSLALE